MLTSIVQEACEARDWTPWKPWKEYERENPNRTGSFKLSYEDQWECKNELADVVIFAFDAAIAMGSNEEEFARIILGKIIENNKRQERGYKHEKHQLGISQTVVSVNTKTSKGILSWPFSFRSLLRGFNVLQRDAGVKKI